MAPHPAGQHRVDRRHGITLPAAARHLCGITPHTPIMLAAAPTDQILVVHPAAITAQLLASHYRNLMGEAADSPEKPDG